MIRTTFPILAAVIGLSTAHAQGPARSPDAAPTFVEPTNAAHRHCSGSCLKNGALQWFCRPDQTCSLECGTAPPKRRCHDPQR
ncbi:MULTISPECIES: hypothetical protein [unclassified Methylobacterium]|uniref:hypothetical protein n=1 Tax=unclassified Methylobacterium TaxID=2615210 RepID=UPI0009DBE710|nr:MULTISPECIES: hypothetical protein [unclassified Methylobacterium]